MTELDGVDPANGTEEHFEDSGAPEVAEHGPDATGAATELPPYTAPDKIFSVVRAVQSRPSADPKVAAVMRALNYRMVRAVVVDPVLGMLPPFDAPDEWDAWLAALVGVALELVSDGVEIDVDQCRANARELLASLFDEAP